MGTALAVLSVLAVVFVAALIATRDGELLVDAPRDRADLDLPLGAPLTADGLEAVRFGMALRGYRMAEVDALLDRLAGELRERDARLAELESPAELDGAAELERPAELENRAELEEPDVEHLPDGAGDAEPLPAVVVRPGAPGPVPLPAPPDATSRAARRW